MRVAVSGATGFLGGHLVRHLLAQGHEVIALGRDAGRLAALEALRARVLPGDLAGTPMVGDHMRAEAFVHAAALSSNWGTREAFLAANVRGTQAALELARRFEVKRFVHISSPSIYFRFEDQLQLREDERVPPPVNTYAESKGLAEQLVLAATDLRPVILRPRGIYGVGDTALLPRLIRAAQRGPLPLLRDGVAVTDITHVDDVVSAIMAAMRAEPDIAGVAINVSGGEALAVRQIAEAACARAGVAVRWRALPAALAFAGAGMMETVAALLPGRPEPIVTRYSLGVLAYSQTLDIGRAKALLGWAPAVSFAEGLARS
jgi:nucleoside-diphosphate-sugar epimerase